MTGRRPTWPREVAGGETALSRARTLARALLRARAATDPTAALDAVAMMAERFGELWLTQGDPSDTYQPGAIMTSEEVAARAGVRVGTVYMWCYRGIIGPPVPAGVDRYVRLRRVPGGHLAEDVDTFLAARDAAAPDGERAGRDRRDQEDVA